MAKHLQYRKTGAQTWLIATFDMVATYTIQELDPVEYEIRVYDTEKDLYSEIITEIASGGYVDVTIPSSLVTTQAGTGINIQDNSLFPKSAGAAIPYSIEIAIKPRLFDNSGYFFNSLDLDSGIRINIYHGSSGGLYFEVVSSTGNRKAIRTSALSYMSLNKWYHIIVTDDGGNSHTGLNMIVNAEEPAVVSNSSGTFTGLPDLTGDYMIRTPSTTGTDSSKFIGKINFVRIYHNKIISLAEATELYNEMQTRPLDGLPFANTCVLEHRFNNNIFSHIGQDGTPVGVLAYDTDLPWSVPPNEVNFYSFTSFPSVMWTQMFKSSDWPEITTTKPYFVIYSTDHGYGGVGAIAWAECDDVYFNGFVERGIVRSGNQAETPFLIRVPTSASGEDSAEIFLYLHIFTGEGTPNQRTELMITTGGLLHEATWIDKDPPLGYVTGENHLGYCRVFERDNGTYVAHHVTKGVPDAASYVSESSDGLTFTRLVETTGMTVGGYSFHKNHVCPFERNGVQYAFVNLEVDGGRKLAIVTLDNNFLPVSIVEILPEFYTMVIIMLYVENDTAYINMKYSDSIFRDKKTYMVEYDLTRLD